MQVLLVFSSTISFQLMPAMKSDLERILSRSHHDPFHYLGAHFSIPSDGWVTLRTFHPGASRVVLLLQESSHDMECIHGDGVFTIALNIELLPDPLLAPFSYRYQIHGSSGEIRTTNGRVCSLSICLSIFREILRSSCKTCRAAAR